MRHTPTTVACIAHAAMAGATSENLEQQKTELETLHSIYYDKITVIKEEQEYMVRDLVRPVSQLVGTVH